MAQSRQPPASDIGHAGSVSAVAFSPDGKWLVSAADDRTVRLWDINTGKQVRVLTHPQAVKSISFSPDGRRIASSSTTTLKIWDTGSGQELLKIEHSEPLVTVAFSPDGHLLASASTYNGKSQCVLNLWNPVTGELVRKHEGRQYCINSLAFTADGRFFATAGVDGAARLWEVSTGNEVRTFPTKSPGYAYSVSFSPDETLLAVQYESAVRVLETASFRELHTLQRPRLGRQVVFSPDGRVLASSGADPMLMLWDTRTWAATRRGLHEDVACPEVAFSSDGKLLAEAYHNVIRIFDAGSFQLVRTLGHFAPELE